MVEERFDLGSFDLDDMTLCGKHLRELSASCVSMEEAAEEIVQYLYRSFVDPESGDPQCRLVRFYKTHRYSELETELQSWTRERYANVLEDEEDVNCLTLLATIGAEREWCDRRASRAHQAIPLPSVDAIEHAPMVHRLISQLGVDAEALVDPAPDLIVDQREESFGVFHVGEARGSPYIPAQADFVERYGIRSVIGFGGPLPSGDLVATIMFSAAEIPRETADLCGPLALSVDLAMLGFDRGRVFASEPARDPSFDPAVAQARVWTLEKLLEVSDNATLSQFERLRAATEQAVERAQELEASRRALRASRARSRRIVELSFDSIITMDRSGLITEFNPEAERAFGYSRSEVLGESLADTIVPPSLREQHRDGLTRYLETGEARVIGNRVQLPAVRKDGSEFPVELSVALDPSGNFVGYVRDITARLEAEQALEQSAARYASIAQTLQQSLLPPELPVIPGIEVAASFHAAGDGFEVGGDFYDVYENAPDDWTVVIGDVCGKGADAAALTALARHTLRTASMTESDPSSVLAYLNEAILRGGTERFCTTSYARLRFDGGEWSATIACAGHPQPLLCRPGTPIEPIGAPGFPLGIFPDASVVEESVQLPPGSLLVFYTDGVVEARGPRAHLDEAQLVTLLAQYTRNGHGPDEVVEAVAQAAIEVQDGDPRDDIAVVALAAC